VAEKLPDKVAAEKEAFSTKKVADMEHPVGALAGGRRTERGKGMENFPGMGERGVKLSNGCHCCALCSVVAQLNSTASHLELCAGT
jgi:hypothetical protein